MGCAAALGLRGHAFGALYPGSAGASAAHPHRLPRVPRLRAGLEFSGVVTAVGPPAPPASDAQADEADSRRSSASSTSTSVPTSTPLPGTGARAFAPGDRVLGVTRFGAYATALNLASDYVRAVPDGWAMEQAAAYPVQTLTGGPSRAWASPLTPASWDGTVLWTVSARPGKRAATPAGLSCWLFHTH